MNRDEAVKLIHQRLVAAALMGAELPEEDRSNWILLGALFFENLPRSFWLFIARPSREKIELVEVSFRTNNATMGEFIGRGYCVPSLVKDYPRVEELSEAALAEFIKSTYSQAEIPEPEIGVGLITELRNELLEVERRSLSLGVPWSRPSTLTGGWPPSRN